MPELYFFESGIEPLKVLDADLNDFELRVKDEVKQWCRDHLSAMPEWLESPVYFVVGAGLRGGHGARFANETVLIAFRMRWS